MNIINNISTLHPHFIAITAPILVILLIIGLLALTRILTPRKDAKMLAQLGVLMATPVIVMMIVTEVMAHHVESHFEDETYTATVEDAHVTDGKVFISNKSDFKDAENIISKENLQEMRKGLKVTYQYNPKENVIKVVALEDSKE